MSTSSESSEPVSSPTAIICSTMGVNTPVAAAQRDRLSPRSTPSRICSMRWPMKALSTVCATTVMAWVMGTPLVEASAKLRAKRASVAFSTIGPATGRRSLRRSQV